MWRKISQRFKRKSSGESLEPWFEGGVGVDEVCER